MVKLGIGNREKFEIELEKQTKKKIGLKKFS